MQKQISLFPRIILILSIVLALGLAATGSVQAAVIDQSCTVPAGEVLNDDFISSCETITIDGTINGLAVLSGSQVTVNGTINGDLIMSGQTVTLSDTGKVTGNVFGFAQTVEIFGDIDGSVISGSAAAVLGSQASVGRNLYYGGYSFEAQNGSQVAIDLYTAVYQAILNGTIERNLGAAAGAIELNGTVGGNATLEVGSSDDEIPTFVMPYMQDLPAAIKPGLRIGSQAKIGGDLKYTSTKDYAGAIQIQPGGQVIYQTPVPEVTDGERFEQPDQAARNVTFRAPIFNTLWKMLRNFITLLALGGLALWLMPKWFAVIIEQARTKALPSAGIGTLVLVGGYFGAGLLFLVILSLGLLFSVLTLGGLSNLIFGVGLSGWALALSIFTMLVSYGSKLVAAFLVGDLLMRQISPQSTNKTIFALLLGVLLYVVVRAIPFFGWIIGLAATLVGLGAIWYGFQALRKPAVPVETPVEAA